MHIPRFYRMSLAFALSVSMVLASNFSFSQRVSIGLGLTGGTTHVATSLRTIPAVINGQLGIDSLTRPGSSAPFLGLNIPVYARLYNLNADQSIGLAINPMFGFYIPAFTYSKFGNRVPNVDTYGGTVMVQVPLMIQFAQGMFSTAETSKERGWGLGLGAEATWLNDSWQRKSGRANPFNYTFTLPPSFMIRPMAALQYRYWSKRDVPVEWALSFSTTQQTYALGTVNRPMIRLSYNAYLNY